MRCTMHKPQDIPFKHFYVRLMVINNYLSLFPVSSVAKMMPPEDLNEILLHALLNVWANQAYLQGLYFETKSYKATYELFERMEVTEKYMKVKTLLKLQLGQTPILTVMAGNEREQKLSCLTTRRQDTLSSARQKWGLSNKLANRRENMLAVWPRALYRRVQST